MPDFRVYPNGYVGVANSLGVQGDTDPEVLVAYDDYLTRSGRQWRWAEEKKYIELAMRLFGCPRWFLERQLANTELCKYRRQYILDTVEFIRTGHRPAGAYTLSSLFNYSTKSLPVKKEIDLPRGGECVALWLSHPYGLDDLIQSMAVFFGPQGPVLGVRTHG